MKFLKSDVFRLYGSHFFLMEGPSAKEGLLPEVAVPDAPAPPEVAAVEERPATPALQEASAPAYAEKTPTSTAQPAPFQHGTPVVWKTRPTARISLIISEAEFRNKLLTTGLKTCVEAAGIAIAHVGFGLMKSAPQVSDFQDMPTDLGIIFTPPPPEQAPSHELPSGKKLYFSMALKDIVMEIANQEKLIKLLQGI